jgi:dCMP deaminase
MLRTAHQLNNYSSSNQSISLEQFIRQHDQEVYGTTPSNDISPLQQLDKLVNLRITNAFRSLYDFHSYLDSINLLDPDRLRPQWDTYFMV